MTNRDKFEEVFGFRPRDNAHCVMPQIICEVENYSCDKCKVKDWWDKEYLPCFRMKGELR